MRFGGTFFICLILLLLGFNLLQGWGFLILLALLIAGGIHAYLSITEHLENIEKHLGIYKEDEEEETLFERLTREDKEKERSFSERLKEDYDKPAP